MKGKNTITLNKATVISALELYFKSIYFPGNVPRITDIQYQQEILEVCVDGVVTDIAKKEPQEYPLMTPPKNG